MTKSRNGIYLTLVLFLGALVTLGSYAFFTWSSSNNKVVSFNTAKELEEYIVYDEGDSQFTGEFKVSTTYTQGIHSTIGISKTNTAANVNLVAAIMMDVNQIGANMKQSTALKWVVTAGDSINVGSVLARGNFIGVNSGDTLTLVPNLPVTTTVKKYTIWIWLDAGESPSDSLSGEILDTDVWTQIDQVEGITSVYEITQISANYQTISATVVNNQHKITAYAVTSTNTEPSSWISISVTDQTNVYNLVDSETATTTGTYYVWFKDEEDNVISEEVNVTAVDTSAPVCTFGSWSVATIANNETATIELTCIDSESAITNSNLTVSDLTKSNNAINITNVTKTSVTNGYKYMITVAGTENNEMTSITLPANSIRNSMAIGNTQVTSNTITIANIYQVTYIANKFHAQNKTESGVTINYNPDTSILTLNGTASASITFMEFPNETFVEGDEYLTTLTYVSGSYNFTSNSSIATEIRKADGSVLTTRNYVDIFSLPDSSNSTISSTLTVSSTGASEGSMLIFWFWYNEETKVFNNYQVKIEITKVETANIRYGQNYTFPSVNPTRNNYTFTGWYTEETGGTQVTSSTIMNMASNHTLYAHWADTTPPVLSTNIYSATFSDFHEWVLSGGAYVDENGYLNVPTVGAAAYNYYDAGGATWDSRFYDLFPSLEGNSAVHLREGYGYYDSNFAAVTTGTGWRTARATGASVANTWVKPLDETKAATTAKYTRIRFYYHNGTDYNYAPFKIKNHRFITFNDVTSMGKMVYLTTSDVASGVGTKKWLTGTHTVADFANSGNVIDDDNFDITSNGTYTVYVEDNAGNGTVQVITVSNIDNISPTANMAYTVESNMIFASVNVTDTGGSGVRASYEWKISESSTCNNTVTGFTQTASSNYSFNTTTAGTYYICVRVKDNAGNSGYASSGAIKNVTLTVNPNGGTFDTSTSNRTINQIANTYFPIVKPTRTGYTFNGWTWSTEMNSGTLYNYGTPLYTDEYFTNGANSITVYNNSGNGTVTHTLVSPSSDDPIKNATQMLQITVNGTASPGLGGFKQLTNSYANAVFYHVIVAKIPVGYTLSYHQNSTGDGRTIEWLTNNVGTGKFETYIYKHTCGSTGTFGTFGHIAINGEAATSENPVTWYVAYANMFDATSGSGPVNNTTVFKYGEVNKTITASWTGNPYYVFYAGTGGITADGTYEFDAFYNNINSHSTSVTTWKGMYERSLLNGTITDGTWGADYLQFNGTSTGVDMKYTVSERTVVTLETTFMLDEVPSSAQYIMGNWQNGGLGLYVSSTSKVGFEIYDKDTSAWVSCSSSSTISAGTKYHLAGTYDGSTLLVYLNGTQVCSKASTGTIGAAADSTHMFLGCNPAGTSCSSGYFKGKIYNAVLTTSARGASAIANDAGKNVTFGSAYGTLVSPTRYGYTFAGWYSNTGLTTQKTSSSTVSTASNHTLYAKWTANTYTINYDLAGGTAGTYAPTSGTFGASVRISNPTKTGHVFTGWTSSDINTTHSLLGTSSTNFTARWNDGAVAKTNQYFKNLSIESGGSVTLTANWVANRTVTLHGYPSSTVSVDGTSYSLGSTGASTTTPSLSVGNHTVVDGKTGTSKTLAVTDTTTDLYAGKVLSVGSNSLPTGYYTGIRAYMSVEVKQYGSNASGCGTTSGMYGISGGSATVSGSVSGTISVSLGSVTASTGGAGTKVWTSLPRYASNSGTKTATFSAITSGTVTVTKSTSASSYTNCTYFSVNSSSLSDIYIY